MKELPEYLIESPYAAKSCGHRNIGHRHLRLVEQLLGKENSPGLGY
jgi:hypothetical protein